MITFKNAELFREVKEFELKLLFTFLSKRHGKTLSHIPDRHVAFYVAESCHLPAKNNINNNM